MSGSSPERSSKRQRASDARADAPTSVSWLEAVINGIRDGVTVQDETGRLVYANDAAARVVGCESAAELLSLEPAALTQRFELFGEDDQPLGWDRLPGRRALAGENDPEAILKYRIAATGEEHWSAVSSRAVHGPDGEPLVVNIFRDITNELVQQRALGWAEARARFLAEAGSTLASSLDYRTTLRTLVRLAVPRIADWCTISMFDHDGELRRLELAHADPQRLEHARDIDRKYPPHPERSIVERVARTGVPELIARVTDRELAALAADDEHLRALRELGLGSVMIVPLIAHEKTLGVLTLVGAESGRRYDDTDLAFAQSLAARAALAIHAADLIEEVRTANRAKSDFLAVISHELRTPLNAIVGFIELLQTGVAGELNPQQTDYIARIDGSIAHLIRLIETVLAFTRIEAGREEVHEQAADLGEIVRGVVALMTPSAQARGITLAVDVPLAAPVRTDVAKIWQILLNLVSNGIKFTERGEVRVLVRRDNGGWVIDVADTGIGIPAGDIAAIWEPFTQLDGGLRRRVDGTGLGLAVSRSLAAMLGAHLSVRSEPDKGSVFTLQLPRP